MSRGVELLKFIVNTQVIMQRSTPTAGFRKERRRGDNDAAAMVRPYFLMTNNDIKDIIHHHKSKESSSSSSSSGGTEEGRKKMMTAAGAAEASASPPPPPPPIQAPIFPPVARSPATGLIHDVNKYFQEKDPDAWRVYSDALTRFFQLHNNDVSMTSFPPTDPSHYFKTEPDEEEEGVVDGSGGGQTKQRFSTSTPWIIDLLALPSQNRKEHIKTFTTIVNQSVHTLPITLQSEALSFLELLARAYPGKLFTHQGTLIDPYTREGITGSHISDLVHFLIRKKRKKMPEPIGWFKFYLFIHNSPIIPKHFLANHPYEPPRKSIDRNISLLGTENDLDDDDDQEEVEYLTTSTPKKSQASAAVLRPPMFQYKPSPSLLGRRK